MSDEGKEGLYPQTGLNRREMLKRGAAGLAAAGALSLGLGAREAQAAECQRPAKWDEEHDVVVIGSGFAGLAAAYEAKKTGVSVVVFEKMKVPGGNSIINGGVVSAAGSPLQAKTGIRDSPELLFNDMLTAGLRLNYPELAKMVADQSLPTVQWTIDELGVKYRDDVSQEGGHSVPRMYTTHNRSGSAIVLQQLAKLKEMGIQPRLRCSLEKLLRDKDGRVKGVAIREGFDFPREASGKVKLVKAKKAVVLATGGFGADKVFRAVQDPRLAPALDTTNQPGATAESLKEALRVGCTPVQLSWIQLGPWGSKDEKGLGLGPFFAQGGAAQYGLWIDTKTGKRFVNELADRKIRADAILRVGNETIALVDEEGAKRGRILDVLPKMLTAGSVKKYDSLEALAQACNIPQEAFLAEVGKWNQAVAAKKDEEWGRYQQKDQCPVEKAPFYVMRLQPKVHHTMGGVQINSKAQAIDILTEKPIAGLYAAGEITGGVHGAVRLGSCATLDCLIFGRVAGQNAAKEKAWS